MGYYIVLVWFFVSLIALIIEIATTDLVSIWFVIAGILTMIISAIWPSHYIVQFICFLVLSTISLILCRPFIKKKIYKNIPTSDPNSMIGLRGKAKSDINSFSGEVLIKDTTWQAISDLEIKKDSLIEIVEQNNLVLKVKEISKGEK